MTIGEFVTKYANTETKVAHFTYAGESYFLKTSTKLQKGMWMPFGIWNYYEELAVVHCNAQGEVQVDGTILFELFEKGFDILCHNLNLDKHMPYSRESTAKFTFDDMNYSIWYSGVESATYLGSNEITTAIVRPVGDWKVESSLVYNGRADDPLFDCGLYAIRELAANVIYDMLHDNLCLHFVHNDTDWTMEYFDASTITIHGVHAITRKIQFGEDVTYDNWLNLLDDDERVLVEAAWRTKYHE